METTATWVLWAVVAYLGVCIGFITLVMLVGAICVLWPRKRRH